MADSWEFLSETFNPALTPNLRVANAEILSNTSVDNGAMSSLGDGPAGNWTPETLMSKQGSSQTGPITNLSYQTQNNKSIKNPVCRHADYLC